jgi:hypothetical protein
MELELKPDWEECRARIDAWWRGEMLDRVPIKVTAPLWEVESDEPQPDDLQAHWTDPDRVIPRLERHMEATYWGGEAAPVMFPVSTGLVAILAAYLGCPVRFLGTRTVWVEPILDDWADPPPLEFDPENEWWRRSAALLAAAAQRAPGRYLVGLPDLNGPGEILARLRGTERLCMDVLEDPDRIPPALEKINLAWYRYFEACTGIVHQRLPGSISWMGIWSLIPSIDLQCDFSCMISPGQFDELFLPTVRRQTEWVARTIYHLDGPGAVGHLDSLLALPELTGIQWVAGAGAPPMIEWTDLCRRVLEAGKLLYIDCEPGEVETLLEELPHEGLLLQTRCASERDAEQLLADMRRWSG